MRIVSGVGINCLVALQREAWHNESVRLIGLIELIEINSNNENNGLINDNNSNNNSINDKIH